jgi:small subunit ribosomal protein S1
VDVYVLDVDRDRKRIALSLKKLLPDPWSLVDDEYRIGELIEGRVTRVLDFGAFIELDLGIEGLLHVSEMIGTPELPPSEIVNPGEKLLVKIIRIESRRRRLALSARQVRRSEWERWVAEQQQIHEEEEAEETAAELEAASPEAEEVVAKAETTSPEAEEDVAEAEAASQEAEETVAEAEAAPPEAEEAVGEAETAPPKTGEAADEAVGALPEAEETAIETASPVPEAADSAFEADSEATEELPSESKPALAAAEPAHNEKEAVAADAAEEKAEVQLIE